MQELQAMERFQVGLGMAGASRVPGKRAGQAACRGKLRALERADREPCCCVRRGTAKDQVVAAACTTGGVEPQLPSHNPA